MRIRMDREQALTLGAGTIDRYLTKIDLAKLAGGATEAFEPGPGYYERVFISDSPVARETYGSSESQGIYQHYGLYIPTTYVPETRAPRCCGSIRAPAAPPTCAGLGAGIIRQLGERSGRVVFSPSARGSSTWYVGRGHESFLETWEDAMASFSIDPDRIGSRGTRWAASARTSSGCCTRTASRRRSRSPAPRRRARGSASATPIEPQDGGDPEAELMFNIIENARNVPYVIFQGTDDELVWVTGVTRMALRFDELGYRNRLYLLLGQEHYSPFIVDEWSDAERYLEQLPARPEPGTGHLQGLASARTSGRNGEHARGRDARLRIRRRLLGRRLDDPGW